MMKHWLIPTLLAAGVWACPATAQTSSAPAVIRVIGHGIAKTSADVAVISFVLRGEGVTSDAALRAMEATRAKVKEALTGRAQFYTARLAIAAARDHACNADDDDSVRLSTGACAVRGYVATMPVTARVVEVAGAGTLTGLIAGLGATETSISGFGLRDPAASHRAAVEAAMADARVQAGLIAMSSGVRLGRLRRVEDVRASDPGAQDIVVTGMRRSAVVGTPVMVALTPEPIETDATMTVEFEIAG